MKDTFLKLGFTPKEAEVYITLNQLGSSLASTLARKNNIKRTSIYDVLNSLIKKNLISSHREGKLTYYSINNINNIILQEKEKLTLATKLTEDLKQLQSNNHSIDINYYKGKEGYKEIYHNILQSDAKEFFVWMHFDEFYKHIDQEFEEKWTQKRIKKKIHARLLLQDTPSARKFCEQSDDKYRQAKLIPKNYMFHTTCQIYKDNISFFDSGDEITGINIQNKGFYEMHKQMFEMVWNLF